MPSTKEGSHGDQHRRQQDRQGEADPDGYHSVTPYLIVEGAARAIEFYKQAFGAKELIRIPAPGDRIGHAEIKVGDSVIMLADEHPEMDAREPQHSAARRSACCST